MSDDSRNPQKITGYLEKRGKLKLMNSWKRYWFVLEGHLLLYYGSKEEYDALSPCKGSITLGPSCTIKPYPSTPSKFQITTRSGCVITLRAESVPEQNKWMQAIFSTLNENQKVDISPTKLCHFRYSTEKVEPETPPLESNQTNVRTLEKEEGQLLERLQRIGARSYCEDIVSHHQKIVNKPKKLDLTSHDKIPTNEDKSVATVSPRRLQFSPKVPKIKEEPTATEEEVVVLEDDDYCVCTLEKNQDKEGEPKLPKTPPETSHRSISFSDAREVFNRSHQTTKTRQNESPKFPGKNPKFTRQNSKTIDIKENNNNVENENKVSEEKKISEVKVETFSDKEPQQNIQDATSQNEENLALTENGKQPSQISLLGNFYESEQEKPPSYQDFRENELYVKQQEKREELYSKPKHFEDNTKRRENPEFKFPPPPFEAYESVDDLTSPNLTNQEDDDSLYEEDFIWQNEIYEPSLNKNEQNTNNKDNNKTFTEVEIDDDLYEEVDMDFVYKKSNERERDIIEVSAKRRIESEESDNNMYEEVDFVTNSSKQRKFSGEQMENDLYAETGQENSFEDSKYRNSKNEENEQKQEKIKSKDSYSQSGGEIQIENVLYAEPTKLINKKQKSTKEIQIENEIYAEPSKVLNKSVITKTDEKQISTQEFQMENDLYSPKTNKHHPESSEDEAFYAEPDFKAKPTFSRQNSEKGTHTFFENELFSQGLEEEKRSLEFEDPNVYEDPDQLRRMSQTKEKKKQKSEELKKQDNFIQRLLKQVTKRQREKSDKGSSCDNADETLALLADIQVLLEKKKQHIKEMVTSSSKPNHRRILSETNAKIEEKDKSLMRTFSIDLSEEYSVVKDCIGDENEVIYSEVEMMDRSSKELKDIIEDLLSRYKTEEKKNCDSQSSTDKD